MQDTEFLASIINQLVDDVEGVRVTRTTDDMGVLLTLAVSKADMGKIIGKEGNMAKAIRTIVNAFGAKNHQKISLKIVEPS